MILFGVRSLRRALNKYIAHYHAERNHQGLGNRLLGPTQVAISTDDPIQHRELLGGMLNFYYREVAWKYAFYFLHHNGLFIACL